MKKIDYNERTYLIVPIIYVFELNPRDFSRCILPNNYRFNDRLYVFYYIYKKIKNAYVIILLDFQLKYSLPTIFELINTFVWCYCCHIYKFVFCICILFCYLLQFIKSKDLNVASCT